MENKVKYKFELVKDVIDSSVLSCSDLIGDVYYTHANPANIESVEIIKIDKHIRKVRNHKSYELKPHRIIVKQSCDSNIVISDELGMETVMSNKKVCDEISENINTSFIESLNNNCVVDTIKYFDRGFISNLFSKRDPEQIISKLVNCNWVIISNKIFDELSKSDKLKTSISEKFTIPIKGLSLCGRIEHISIYISDQIKDNEMYIGKLDSITAVFNKNAEVDTFKCGNFYEEGLKITLEYLFKNNGINKIILE